ncbi:MAG: hypothetical protein R3B96_07260 [Pirellulaceae bacterium]
MRTSAKYLIGSLALGLFTSDAYATQGPIPVHNAWRAPVVALQVSGGSFQPGAHPDRVEAENWLRNARNAMEQGRPDIADFSIRKAEEHAARIPASEPALTYTPQQARQDLMALSTPAAQPAPAQQPAPMAQLSVPQPGIDPALAARIDQANRMMADAQSMLQQGNFNEGLAVIRQAIALQVPEAAFPQGQWTPQALERRVIEDLQARGINVPAMDRNVIAGAYNPASDATRNQPAGVANPFNGRLGQEPAQLPVPGVGALNAQQDLLKQKLTQEIFLERAHAERMVEQKDPRGALALMQNLRIRLETAEIDPQAQRQMLQLVDREIASLEDFIQRNISEIEVNEQNAQRMADVHALQAHRIEVEQRVAELIEQFNGLMDENRFMEAEVLARQAADIAPELPAVQTMIWKAKYARNLHEQMAIREMKGDGVVAALTNVESSSVPFDDSRPLQFDVRDWADISRRSGMGRERQRSVEEVRILNTLRTAKINLQFDNVPLKEALDIITAQTQVGFYFDRSAMMDEAVTSDTPVSINLSQPIVMESGLVLLLENLNLTFEVRDDVVRITSPRAKSRQAEPVTYYVGDLVIPIPNFAPTYNMGLAGAMANAYNNLGYGPGGMSPAGMMGGPNGFLANSAGGSSVASQALAQNLPPGSMSSGMPGLFGGSNGQMGGGIQADFDPLMELIQQTIAPDSWEELGGPGRMQEFQSNLSLVIYQSQEVHEQIQDLLDQLRRLQDLQITIEVRFITLQDDFFERIGVDFDFQVRDNHGLDANGNPALPINAGTGVAGLAAPSSASPTFTSDGDITFSQNTFGSAVPQFGGFDPNTAANFGFAILSDIEVYMVLQAAKGDTRTNILQAPKVTLFNGQTANVIDLTQRPFVTGIIPVVGDFAAAQMPVVVVLNEGTQLSVNAVATDDRRFVRLTLVPVFSQVGAVEEFTFEGTETTTTGTAVIDPTDPNRTITDGATTTRTGSTVQLPAFAITSIMTTVSVPDGGTILLGGIKRLQEGRNERGVPMLSSLPFVNRLFKNVGIGRTTQSLMMMVTPRIIIQEEEEANQVGIP